MSTWTARWRRTPPIVLGFAACLFFTGCLPRERINAACQWTDDAVRLAPPGDPVRRAHLIEDVRVAQDLGIRYGDVIGGRFNNESNRDARARCTEASLAEIMRRHEIRRAEINAGAGMRELWIDLLAVFLPMTAVFLVVSRAVAARIVAGNAAGDRKFAACVLALWTPIAAGVALAVTQIWGVAVEQLRLRDEHISYRAFALPASRHGWLVWGVATGLFAAVSALALLRAREAAHSGSHAPR